MRLMALGLSLLVWCAAANPVGAAFDTEGWTWQRPVTDLPETPGFVRLSLPLDVLDDAQTTLGDMRLIDAQGNLIPFVTYRSAGPEAARLEWQPVQLLNPVFQPEQYSRVTADFGGPTRKNRIKVETSGENFRRRVQVEGSVDGQAWDLVLESGWLFHVPLPNGHDEVNELDMPLNDFRYLRLTVFNMPDDPRRIEVLAVMSAVQDTPRGPALLPVEIKATGSAYDEKTRSSVYELDLGYRNVPVETLHAKVADSYFYRAYALSGRNAKTQESRRQTETGWESEEREAPWTHVSQGVLYRMEHDGKVSESTTLEHLNAPYRYLQLRVYEQDNPPLRIESFAAQRRDVGLIFEYRPDAKPVLAGGNPDAVPPSFDLRQAVGDLEKRELPKVGLGEEAALVTEPKSLPWAQRFAWVVWAALFVAVGVAVLLIARNLGRLREV